MAIEKIKTITGRHPIKNYPFSRDGVAYRCNLCGGIWLKEKESKNHDCKPIDDEYEPKTTNSGTPD